MSLSAEIIAVGTEILLGEITNTDAVTVARALSELGINAYYQTVVGDNPDRLYDVIMTAKKRADIIITTGGLGPTFDDLTKQVAARAFGKELVLNEKELEKIKAYFKNLGRNMTENNARQAYLPEGCEVFVNEWGTAPGCAIEDEGKILIMLPGPPRECKPMVKYRMVPYLKKLSDSHLVSHSIRIYGISNVTVTVWPAGRYPPAAGLCRMAIPSPCACMTRPASRMAFAAFRMDILSTSGICV